MEKFGDYLKKLRKKAGVTQDIVAARLDVSGAYIHQLEAGKIAPPTEERCRQLADALQTSFEEIWDFSRRERLLNIAEREGVIDAMDEITDQDVILSGEERALIKLLRHMDAETRKDFNGLVVMLLRRHAGDDIKKSLEEFVQKCA